jgi:predicted MFS family arabinose efflux permease
MATRGSQLTLLALAGTAGLFALASLGPLQETMTHALPLSDNQVAVLQGPAMALPTALVLVPLGLVIDRCVRIRFIWLCTALYIIAGVATAFAPGFATLFAARATVAVAVTSMTIAIYSLLADYYAPEQRGRAKAVVVVGQYVGKSAAFALGGALLGAFGPGQDSWRYAMLGLAAPPLLIFVSMSALEEAPRTACIARRPSTRSSFREFWRNRAVIIPLTLGVATVDFPRTAALIWAAPTLSRNFGLPPQKVGAIMAMVLIVSGLLGPVAGGLIADACQRMRRPRLNMLVLSGLMLLSIPTSLFAMTSDVASSTILLVLFVATSGAALTMGMTLFTVIIPNELRALSLSIMTVTNVVLVGTLSPLAVSMLSGALGGGVMIGKAVAITCVVTGAVSAATFAFGGLNPTRGTGRALPRSERPNEC